MVSALEELRYAVTRASLMENDASALSIPAYGLGLRSMYSLELRINKMAMTNDPRELLATVIRILIRFWKL